MSSDSATPNSNSYSTSSTPANPAPRKKTPSKTTPKKPTPPRKNGSRSFTSAMQDKQARNKDVYSSGSSSDEGELSWASVNGRLGKKDTYEQSQKRREAAVILDNPELLMMHAQARLDSIPGTRHYFTKLLCGYLPDNEPYSHFSLSSSDQHPPVKQRRNRQSSSRNHESIQRQFLHEASAEDGDGDDSEEDGDEEMVETS